MMTLDRFSSCLFYQITRLVVLYSIVTSELIVPPKLNTKSNRKENETKVKISIRSKWSSTELFLSMLLNLYTYYGSWKPKFILEIFRNWDNLPRQNNIYQMVYSATWLQIKKVRLSDKRKKKHQSETRRWQTIKILWCILDILSGLSLSFV